MAKNVGLVLSHPDDEVLFFSATISSLKKSCLVTLIFLSSGNAEGKKDERLTELAEVAMAWKVDYVVCTEELHDGDIRWEPGEVEKALNTEKYDLAIISMIFN
jgi:LmbE family N-acetylglucosaminyl deacetylase